MSKRRTSRKKVKCPICGWPLNKKVLEIHIKNLHASDNISNKNKSSESRRKYIDESGFLTNPSLWKEKNTDSLSRRLKKIGAPLPKVDKPSDHLDKIDQHVEQRGKVITKKTSKNKKEELQSKEELHRREKTQNKIKIPWYYHVNCPICDYLSYYKFLYDHIRKAHPKVNPKIEMAKLNEIIRMNIAIESDDMSVVL